MSDITYCLVCHHNNSVEAQVCSFCGAPIPQSRSGERAGQMMDSVPVVTKSLDLPSRHYLPKLPDNSFALFVLDNPEPLIVENSEAIYLGRFTQNPAASSVDLTKFGAAELGVSRSHARITWSDGVYRLEDLASTNGTWLNYQRLAFGKSFELHNGDILLLGQLQLTVCLPESVHKWEVAFDVRRNQIVETVNLPILTPFFMQTVLSKFLQGIIDFQQICLQSRGQNTEEIHILSIRAGAEGPLLHISLDKANEAVNLIRKWVNPLRQAFAGLASSDIEVQGPVFQKELSQMVENILLDINPGLDDDAHKAFGQQLNPAVMTLIFSELEIISL
jgi:hypothetical protein